ncbi:MAG: ATP-dependent protease ATPase subunit HslU [Atopostipes suicloacalis]|nr:ATP-dependent protease ATPase subunit HslU [Atopostipes suicloacalis]MDN6731131.1 ATP-dependent protease ATPase subunit HslU [Atopostipes suicloacalis]
MLSTKTLTPKEIVERLDQYIIGQDEAKKAVAIALRNRYRRQLIDEDMQKEITPKNILMIGPTGVGKTEIARRLADTLKAPFVKIEATKFTEVGYVGRDVESMVRDLLESAIQLVREEKRHQVHNEAEKKAIKRIAKAMAPGIRKEKVKEKTNPIMDIYKNMGMDPSKLNLGETGEEEYEEEVTEEISSKRTELEDQIRRGMLDSREIDIKVEEKQQQAAGPMGEQFEQMGIDLMGSLGSMRPPKKVDRRLSVKDAVEVLTEEEADKLISTDDIHAEAIHLAENDGIIFLDEIDKIASGSESGQQQVSREGVQRDILPIVEGSVVRTKYGNVKTDYMLFIGSGAFHMAAPSDLIPELQGRFPIRVELNDLTADDFVKILTEPRNSLVKQYQALLATENIDVHFTMDAVEEMASIAQKVNEETDNIGARRLHTILEKLLEELLFEASDIPMGEIKITKKYVEDRIGHIAKDQDLSHYIL